MNRFGFLVLSMLISIGIYDIVLNAGSSAAFEWGSGSFAGIAWNGGSLGPGSAQAVHCGIVAWLVLEFFYSAFVAPANELRSAVSALKASARQNSN
jgi:hypothetical protein